MPRAAHVLAALVLALQAPGALAAHWVCNLSEELVELVCVADVDPMQPASDPNVVQAVVRGVAFPLDETLQYRVPLWTPPSDPKFVELLAQATLCFRSPGCTVALSPDVWASLSRPRLVASASRRRR